MYVYIQIHTKIKYIHIALVTKRNKINSSTLYLVTKRSTKIRIKSSTL